MKIGISILLAINFILLLSIGAMLFIQLQEQVQLNEVNRYCAQLNAEGVIIDREPYCLRVHLGSTFLDSVEEIEKELKGE